MQDRTFVGGQHAVWCCVRLDRPAGNADAMNLIFA
jgi:hypothetical protein